jgi:serine/threonine protein kinase
LKKCHHKVCLVLSSEVLAGTPNYIAPEILRRGKISFKIDVFALGSILYYMLSGLLPFNDYSLMEIFNRTLDGEYQFPEKKFEKVSTEAKDLIDKLLENDP